MTQFAKLWTDILADPKLMRAARKGAKQLVLLPWLIAFAQKCDDDGRLTVNGEPAETIDLASQMPGVSEKQVAQALAALENIGILVRDYDDALRFSAWEHRAGKPSDTRERVAQRVAKHRERKRQQRGEKASAEPESNAAYVTPRNALEEEEEKDQELQPQQPPPASAPNSLDALPAWTLLAERLGDRHAPQVRGFLELLPPEKHAGWTARLSGWLDGLGVPPDQTPTTEVLGAALSEYEGDAAPRHVWAFVADVRRRFTATAALPSPRSRTRSGPIVDASRRATAASLYATITRLGLASCHAQIARQRVEAAYAAGELACDTADQVVALLARPGFRTQLAAARTDHYAEDLILTALDASLEVAASA